MIEISSSVEKKDPAAAGSFFFCKNVYFVSTKTWQDSNFDIIPIDGIYQLLYICLRIHHAMCLDINGNTAQEADALTSLNN